MILLIANSLDLNLPGTSAAPTELSPPIANTRTNPTPDLHPKAKLIRFGAEWGGLRKKCDIPKTTTKVIETMRAEALDCLRISKLVSQETLDLLDNNWDQLGTERVVKFFNLFLLHKEDDRLRSADCPLAYLKGMIDSTIVSQRVIMTDLMERMAGITADLTLASDATQTYKKSLTTAEESWREQSSLISNYISQTESHLKTLTNRNDQNNRESKQTSKRKEVYRLHKIFVST